MYWNMVRMPQSLHRGRFVLLGTLGEGSQGCTFDAVDSGERRPVAIKRFDVRGATAWKDVELAEREARVLQSLSHPMLPRYIDRFEEDGALYLVMEKVEGESLATLRGRDGAVGEAEIMRLLSDASEVLAYLHGRAPPVIHRDLKPGNVIRRPDGSFAFVDFGAVRNKLRPEGGSTVVGTFGFMAPEQFQGRALPASDVYAIGATAMAMLTGHDPQDLPHEGLGLDVRAALAGRASDRLVGVLEQMLEPNPDLRAPSIAALLEQREGPSRGRKERARRAREPWETWRETFAQDIEQWARGFEHAPAVAFEELPRLSRAMRQMRRKAGRQQRRAWRRERRGRMVPWPFSFLLAILFTLSIVFVSLATQVVAPVVLSVLSIVFGRALRTAAASVRSAGKDAIVGIRQSRQWLDRTWDDDAQPAQPDRYYEEPRKVRVADDGSSWTEADDEVAAPTAKRSIDD
jgi:hypothetical protein